MNSYSRGATEPQLLHQTIGDCFDQTAERWPDNLALVCRQQELRWSYRQLQQHVNHCARALLALGVEVGDRVGIWSPNNAEWCITQLASAKIGALLVCLNPAYRLHEVKYALTKSQCSVVIAAERFKGSDYSAMLQQLVPELSHHQAGKIRSQELPVLRAVVSLADEPSSKEMSCKGVMSWKQLQGMAAQISATALAERQASLNCQQAINIQ